jgi:hypothetical protein
MGFLMPLQKQLFNIPVSGGVDTKTDPFQVAAPNAALLENARFQKTGKLSKRFGLVALTTSSNDGGFSTSEPSSIACDNDYLATLTKSGVYAYSEGDEEWYKQSSFGLSSKIQTQYVSKSQFNQRWPDFDMTLDGTHMVYVCAQNSPVATFNSSILVILQDVSTGLRKSASINLGSPGILRGARCIVEKSSGTLYVHVFYFDGSEVKRTIYDENLSPISSGVTIVASSGTGAQFDLCKDSSKIYFAHLLTTTLELVSYNFAGTQQDAATDTVTNAIRTQSSIGRGLSICQTTSNIHVAWISSTDGVIKGFTKSLVDDITEATYAAQLQKISICANGSTIVLVSDSEASNSVVCTLNHTTATFTTTYTIATPLEYERVVFTSQPFAINSKNFVICRTNETENKNFYLLNLSDEYIAQTFSPGLATSQSVDGTVADATVSKSVVYSGVARTNLNRIAIFGGTDNFDTISAMSLNEHDFNQLTSDGSKSKVGETLYHSSGHLIELDKLNVVENSFLQKPRISSVSENGGTPNPNVASKTFSYIAVYEFYNSNGERTLSAPSPLSTITTTAGAASVSVGVRSPVLSLRNRLSSTNFNSVVAVVLYRTANGGATFFRNQAFITSFNDGAITTLTDTASDASIQDGEQLYTTGDVLENNPPPPAKFMVSGGNRLFLSGIEERDEIAYSKKQLFGETVAFSDFFRIRVASGTYADRTPISALGYMDSKLIIFREQSIYFVQGDGPNELGVGLFTDPEIIQSDVGCVDARSVLSMPNGLMFKSRKGIYLLDRGLAVSYIGAQVEDYNDENIVASVLSDKFNECRFYTDQGNCLVYNYLFQAWSVFTDQTSIDADNWQSSPVSIIGNTVFKETENTYLDNGATGFYPMKYVSPWLKLDQIQGFIRVYRLWILGTNKSTHTLKCKIYTDYDETVSDDYDLNLDVTDQPQYQFNIHIPKQKCEAIRFEIFDDNHAALSNGEAYDLSNIQLEIGFKAGGYKLASTKSY